VAGAKGIILDPKGKQALTYEWGLGIATNNQAEAYALLQKMYSINAVRARTLIFIGDSIIIINLMNNKKLHLIVS